MTDYEREIETQLAEFQRLTGKGNVKDSNRTLYDILRLMLVMFRQQAPGRQPPPPTLVPPPPQDIDGIDDGDDLGVPEALETPATGEPASGPAPAETLPCAPDGPSSPTPTAEAQVIPGKDPRRPINAPYGFTAAGNVRRKR